MPHSGAGAMGHEVEQPGVRRTKQKGLDFSDGGRDVQPEIRRFGGHLCFPSRSTAALMSGGKSRSSRSGSRFSFRIRSEALAMVKDLMSNWGVTSAHWSGMETGAPGSGRALNGATM